MNKLIVGLGDKSELVNTTSPFLLIDDGPLADLVLKEKRAKLFDPMKDGMNPLPCDYIRARELVEILYGQEGKDTLTVRNGKSELAPLLAAAKRLGEVNGSEEVNRLIADLMFSPVLRKCLNGVVLNFSDTVCTVARVDRKKLGDFDARVVGQILISLYPHTIVIPDFGFYARPFHAKLVKEGRLRIGLFTLNELEDNLRRTVLLIEKKEGRKCTVEDAKTLAGYSGWMEHSNEYNATVER